MHSLLPVSGGVRGSMPVDMARERHLFWPLRGILAPGWGKVPELVKIGKVVGPTGAVVGELYDIYAVIHGDITPTHFAANSTATLASATEILAPFAVAYFVVDAFVPGGVGGIVNNVSNYQYSQARANDPPPAYQNTDIEDMSGWNR